MEAVKSKVKSVQGAGSWESKHGILYQFDYEFEDGVVMQANHKTPQSPFSPGDEVEYTVKRENDFGKSGNVQKFQDEAHRAHATNTYTKSKGSNASFALSYAKDLYVPVADQYIGQENKLADEVLIVAERFNTWLNNN